MNRLIRLDINDETSITSIASITSISNPSLKSMYILAFQNMKELENISNFCQKLLNETGNVQNSILLYIKSDKINEKKVQI